MNLSEQVTKCVVGSGLNDYDQRSAIGMARTWVDKREPIVWNPNQVEYPKRDQLAKDIVAMFEANPAEPEEYVEALAAARKVVNAPYHNDWRTGGALMKPGAKKKAAQSTEPAKVRE